MTLNWERSSNKVSSSGVITLPVPYELPPQPYSSEGDVLILLFIAFLVLRFFRLYITFISLLILCGRYTLVLGPKI